MLQSAVDLAGYDGAASEEDSATVDTEPPDDDTDESDETGKSDGTGETSPEELVVIEANEIWTTVAIKNLNGSRKIDIENISTTRAITDSGDPAAESGSKNAITTSPRSRPVCRCSLLARPSPCSK
jgi:hypothetical protein